MEILKSNDDYTLNIQWFPGHMAKTRRIMAESLGLVDAVCEVLDARAPLSTQNPEIDVILKNKPRLIILNKCDLAEENVTKIWHERLKSSGRVLAIDCKTGRNINRFLPEVRNILAEKIERNTARGMKNKKLRVMVVGITNVGKSTLINRLGKMGTRVRVENRPGVTRGNQWINCKDVELLDTPGILWPKFEDVIVADNLAFLGSIKDQVLDIETLALKLIRKLREAAPAAISNRYKIEDFSDDVAILEAIAKIRGFKVRGGDGDTERAAITLLDEFRNGVLGRISLEKH